MENAAENQAHDENTVPPRGRAVGANGGGGVMLDLDGVGRIGVSRRVRSRGWSQDAAGREIPGTSREHAVWVVWARVGSADAAELREYPETDRALACAFLLALAPWIDIERRAPTPDECNRIEDNGPPVVREAVEVSRSQGSEADGASCAGFRLGSTPALLDRVALAFWFARALDRGAVAWSCLGDEDDRQRVALELAAAWSESPDVACVLAGLEIIERGDRLAGHAWESWLVSVARLAGTRHAEVSK